MTPPLAYWVHDLSPFVIRFGENFGIRWYGLAYVLGFLAGGWLMMRYHRADRSALPAERVPDFIVALVAAIGNYTATVNSNAHVLAITPAALTITADDKSRLVGDPNPPFTATYSGFVQGNVTSWNGTLTPINDTPANLGGALVFATPATPSSPVGAYNITPSGQTSSNYAISYVDGTLTVTTINPNANQIPADVLASIYSGKDQLPPPTISGPTDRWGQLQGLPSAMPGVQPDSRTAGSGLATLALGDAGTSSGTPGVAGVAGSEARPRGDLSKTGVEPIPNGAVRDLVTIINGGVRMSPRQGGRLGWVGRR